MSAFNAEQFLKTTSKQANDTKIIPVPAGEHKAQVDKLAIRKTTNKDTNEERYILDVSWHILTEEAKQVTGMEKPMVRQSIFLDLTPEKSLDFGKGKNVQLGKLREACGQNKDGKAWAPQMLQGSICTVTVSHRPEGDEIYSDVKKVTVA